MNFFGQFERRPRIWAKPTRFTFRISTGRTSEIDKIDVFVARPDVRQLNTGRPAELHGLAFDIDIVERIADQLDRDAGLLENLPVRRVIGEFVSFDVTTGWQPPLQLVVVVQEYLLTGDNENRHSEVTRWRSGCVVWLAQSVTPSIDSGFVFAPAKP